MQSPGEFEFEVDDVVGGGHSLAMVAFPGYEHWWLGWVTQGRSESGKPKIVGMVTEELSSRDEATAWVRNEIRRRTGKEPR